VAQLSMATVGTGAGPSDAREPDLAEMAARVEAVRKQKEAAKREYEQALRSLHIAEHTENRANIQLHAFQRLADAFEHKKYMDDVKKADQVMRQQRRQADHEAKQRNRQEEQARKEDVRRRRDQLQKQKNKETDDARKNLQHMLQEDKQLRENNRQASSEAVTQHRERNHQQKGQARQELAQNLVNVMAERQQQVAQFAKEARARAKEEEQKKEWVKEQRKVRLPRAACENKTAERRAKVADYMLEKIQSEDRESELLMAEMKRLQKVQEEKEQQMLRTQRRLQALNESLVQASQGNSTGRSARKYLAPK